MDYKNDAYEEQVASCKQRPERLRALSERLRALSEHQSERQSEKSARDMARECLAGFPLI
jgi:hypothetical protein